MRVVLDTNVIVAAFAAQGLCHLVFEIVLAHHTLLVSSELLSEVEVALKKKLKMPRTTVEEICNFIAAKSELVSPKAAANIKCRDQSDVKILALADQGRAEFLITGDNDLLEVRQIGGAIIINPRGFWEHIKKT